MGRPLAPHFFCLIWLVVAQIDLRINSPQEQGRLQDGGKAPDHHRIGGYATQSSNVALTFEFTGPCAALCARPGGAAYGTFATVLLAICVFPSTKNSVSGERNAESLKQPQKFGDRHLYRNLSYRNRTGICFNHRLYGVVMGW